MIKSIRLSDFGLLSMSERDAVVRDLCASALARGDGELRLVESRIRAFERQYEMSSAAMEAQVASGALQETADIASWLIALDAQRRSRGREA